MKRSSRLFGTKGNENPAEENFQVKKTPSFIISATSSGSGKTTVSLALMSVLKERGYRVQPFKVGPDYIDPQFHRAVCGRPSYNLDTWMMGVEEVKDTFLTALSDADVGVIEGVMGLFDGKDDGKGEGSTADIAKVLGIPVMLVVDASMMAQSIAPLVYGYERFDPDVKIAGVVFNKVGSHRHFTILKKAVEERCTARVIGYLEKDCDVVLPERHLGLSIDFGHSSQDRGLEKALTRLRDNIGRSIDLKTLLSLSSAGKEGDKVQKKPAIPQSKTCTIAVAMDEAFSFYYEKNLDILKELGAEIKGFSPIRDTSLPAGVDGVYIGGGYPELYAEKLRSNKSLRDEINKLSNKGLPIYAECGGLIYLGRILRDFDGRSYEMAGIFPWTSRMLDRRRTLGYKEVEVTEDISFIEKGHRLRGHEFHYSEIEGDSTVSSKFKRVYRLRENSSSGMGDSLAQGYLHNNTLVSYIHIHFSSNRNFPKGFVEMCRRLKRN